VVKTVHTHKDSMLVRYGGKGDEWLDDKQRKVEISKLPSALWQLPAKIIKAGCRRWGGVWCLVQYGDTEVQRFVLTKHTTDQMWCVYRGTEQEKKEAAAKQAKQGGTFETAHTQQGPLDEADIKEVQVTVAGPALMRAPSQILKRKYLEFLLHDNCRKAAFTCPVTEEQWQLWDAQKAAALRDRTTVRKARAGKSTQYTMASHSQGETKEQMEARLLAAGVDYTTAPTTVEEAAETMEQPVADDAAQWVAKQRTTIKFLTASGVCQLFAGLPACSPYPVHVSGFDCKWYQLKLPVHMQYDKFEQELKLTRCEVQMFAADKTGRRPDTSNPIAQPQSRGPVERIVGGREWIQKRMRP
jgi:hypothetical protein